MNKVRPGILHSLRDVIGLIPGPLQFNKIINIRCFMAIKIVCQNGSAASPLWRCVTCGCTFRHYFHLLNRDPLATARTFSGGRDEFNNPPYIYVRDYLGGPNPNCVMFSLVFNPVMVTHKYPLVFAICQVVRFFRKVKLWQVPGSG